MAISDELFARTINQMGIATLDQIEAAALAQQESLGTGAPCSLADVLVKQGIVTQAIRENVEKKALAVQQGGIKQIGPYKILKKLGEGGMGAVYLAEDTHVGRKVALKVLPKKHSDDQTFLSRFRREAKATGQLNHVNIVTAYTTGEDMGVHYYAMEFCEGEPLDAKLKREKTLPWDKAIEITIQVARGLKHAHEHHLIHRDIKPANILYTNDGIAKILDLGLAKHIGDKEQSFNTQSGVALGTPHYISPEQARGDKEIDGRTDIYSLGATLYHLLTGQTPFEGSTAAMIMMRHITGQLPNPQDIIDTIPDGIVLVIQRMMAKEPADRYRDCDELLSDLELVIDGKAPHAHGLDEGKSSIAMRLKNPPPRRTATRATPRVQPRKGAPAANRPAEGPTAAAALPPKKKPFMSPLLAGGGVAAAVLLLAAVLAFSGKKKDDTPKVAQQSQPVPTVSNPVDVPKPDVKPVMTVQKVAVEATKGGVDDAWIKSVQAKSAEEQVKAVIAKLKELNPKYDGVEKHGISQDGKVDRLEIASAELEHIAPIRALKGLQTLACSGEIGSRRNRVADLRPLKDLPLNSLNVTSTRVADLSPLSKMPLTNLTISETSVTSLEPLRGMKLDTLQIARLPVRDLSPLTDMPIRWIDARFCTALDFSTWPTAKLIYIVLHSDKQVLNLAGLRTWDIIGVNIDYKPEYEAELRATTSLTGINGIPIAEFWAKNGGAAAENIDDPARWAKAIDVLKLIDPAKDPLTPGWTLQDGVLITDKSAAAKLQSPYRPPEEYDSRIEFSTTAGSQFNHYGIRNGKAFSWILCTDGRHFGIEMIDGHAIGEVGNTTTQEVQIAPKVRHVSILQVRNNFIRAWLDGKLMAEIDPVKHTLGLEHPQWKHWALKDETRLALGTRGDVTQFHKIEVLEITGKGTFTRPNDPAAIEAEKKRSAK